MSKDQADLSLHPAHRKNLREESGLIDEIIREHGIYSVPPADISRKLEGKFPGVESLLAFSYFETDGHERYKLFPPQQTEKGAVKYYQKSGSPCRLYIPPRVGAVLQDVSIPLYITEGEKKTLKAIQEGIHCIGLGGLWNWSDRTEEKNLISDFDRINLKGRTVYIVPDNDWLSPDRHGEAKNLRQGVYELAYRLIDRGARVHIIELPQGPEKGLDDFLCRHTVDEFKALLKREVKKQTAQEMIEEATAETLPEILKRLASLRETEQALHINALAKKLNIPKRAIQKDLKAAGPSQEIQEISTSAYFPELVDLVTDKEGAILFLINREEVFEGVTVYEVGGNLYKPPERGKIPFSIPRAEEVMRWMNADTAETLFNDLLSHLKKFSYLPDHQFIVVVCFTFLTYIQDHPDIHYFAMLLFWSAPERGKSRTGKAIASCSFRGIHVVDLREANLFRYSQDFRATLFIDVMDLWKKAEKNGSEDILLFRYERGAIVARVLWPEKGPFNDMVFYDVYGPTIMASNESIHHILDTRCIPISMQNRPGDYENPNPEKSLEMRERLTAWRAKVMSKPLPDVEPIPGIAGRLWDISEPLFQVCKMVAPSHIETLKNAILEVAGQRIEDKQETLDGQIVSILNTLSPPDGILSWVIQIQDIADKLNEKRPENHKLTPRYVGQRVKGLSIPKKKKHGVYEALLTRSILNTLLAQYGFENKSSESIPHNTFPKSPNIHNLTNSDAYAEMNETASR